MIKKGTDKHFNKIAGCPSLREIQKMHLAELLITLEEYNQCEWKITPRRDSKKKKNQTKTKQNKKQWKPKTKKKNKQKSKTKTKNNPKTTLTPSLPKSNLRKNQTKSDENKTKQKANKKPKHKNIDYV